MGGRRNIFSVHVPILTRGGASILKMPASTAATVNQFPNPKVSDGKRERGKKKERVFEGEGQGCHLLFLIRMDQSSSASLSLPLPFLASFQAFILPVYHPSIPPSVPPSLLCNRILGPFQGILKPQGRVVTSKCHPSTAIQPRETSTKSRLHSSISSPASPVS